MKILIVTYHFFPENTPRAFRAFELAKGFARKGHNVKVIIPNIDFDYSKICEKYGFEIGRVYTKRKLISTNNINSNKDFKKTIVGRALKNLYYSIFPSKSANRYVLPLFQYLNKEEEQYDMLISNAYPYCVHTGVILSSFFNPKLKQVKTKVAEYSDPLTGNINFPKSPLYPIYDKFITRYFDYITVPTNGSIALMKRFKDESKIFTIPQSIDISEIELVKFKINTIPNFAFAGRFYENVRNPSSILDFLAKSELEFRFIIYTKYDDPSINNLLNIYKKKLGKKLVLRTHLPRLEVIKELSKMDFLVNIENNSDTQAPSKLIDYGVTERPIYSFKSFDFNEYTMMNFLNGNYEEAIRINIKDYYLEKIIEQFEALT
jgi:hypothetical protein